MRKIFFILSIILISSLSFAQSWVYLGALPTNDAVNSISVVNENIIWVCGDATLCYRSTNGGFNWIAAYTGLPGGNLYGISAVDANNCWVGTGTGSIYRTTNGGTSWTLQISVAGSFINGIKMFNSSFGVYTGDPTGTGQPYQNRTTTNGGTNWVLSPTSPIAANEFGVINAWDWIDSLTFWIGSANTLPNATSAKIYKTTTGFNGAWTSATVMGNGGAQGLYYQAVAFINATSGMAGSNGSNLRKTTDGGVTWTNVTNPPGLTTYSAINMHGFKDNSGLIRVVVNVATSDYRVFKTTNLGSSWTQETLPSQGTINGFQHMQFLNQSLGFAGGNAGTFFRYGPPLAVDPNNHNVPTEFSLQQNYPNPFNPSTTIKYSVPNAGNVSVKIYNNLGMEVKTVINKFHSTGNYQETVNMDGFSSGVYFYTMQSGDFKDTKRMILVK